LHLLRCSDVAKPLLDALNHHVPDHLAGNPGRGCHPADDFAIIAVQREGDPDNLAAPTGELQDIRTPSLIGTAGYDGPIMDTRGTPPGMPGQEKPVLLHQPVDPLKESRPAARRSRLRSAAIRRHLQVGGHSELVR
jgi:hypothetical protein